MAEIVQTLGFDAAGAIATLRELNAAEANLAKTTKSLSQSYQGFNRTANTTLNRLQSINQGFAGISTSAATQQVNTFGAAVRSHVPVAAKDVQRLNTSLSLLSRIVFTQAIVRGLSQVRNALSETVDETAKFQKQVALAQTLSGGVGFEQIADRARDISKQLGIEQTEVAAGIGQALSNQVGDFATSVQFTKTAAEFAKATGSTLPESVNLLSSALKSFNLSAADTEKVADKFFVAIDKGRLTASGLANSLGRVLPIAGELGITLDEVNGFLAAASITGANEAEVITQLRGAMSAFVKPSEGMEDALKNLGFASGKAAVEQLGFKGAIDAVRQSATTAGPKIKELFPDITNFQGAEALAAFEKPTDALKKRLKELGFESGTAAVRQLGLQGAVKAATTSTKDQLAALGELFPNVRALTGVVAGLNTQVEHYDATVAASANATGKLSEALGIVEATGAARFEKAMNRISVAFSEGFGDRFLTGSATALEKLQEVGNAINRIGTPFSGGLNSDAFSKAVRDENEKQKTLLDQRVDAAKKADEKLVEQATKTAERLRALGQVKEADRIANLAKSQGSAGQQKAQTEAEQAKLQKDVAASQLIVADIAKQQELSNFGKLKPLTDELTKLSSGQIDTAKLALIKDAVRQLTEAMPNATSTQQLQIAVAELDKAAIAQAKLTNAENLNLLVGSTAQTGENLSSAIGPATALAEQLERAAKASKNVQVSGSVLGSGQPASQLARGGVARWLAAGGMARYLSAGGRGSDTIPAMLSPGEFVVNAASSKRFFSQLVSMNAGKQPVFRESGGAVTNNVNVGDIHLHQVTNAHQASRLIASGLRREFRRSTSLKG